jgi:hypothetical protein
MQNVERSCGKSFTGWQKVKEEACTISNLYLHLHLSSYRIHRLSSTVSCPPVSFAGLFDMQSDEMSPASRFARNGNSVPIPCGPGSVQLLRPPGVLHAVDDGTVAPKIASEGLICGEPPNRNR